MPRRNCTARTSVAAPFARDFAQCVRRAPAARQKLRPRAQA